MKTLKFNSAICTSRSQSERLLALGLKKETADCYYYARQRWNGNDYENTGELILEPIFNQNDNGHYEYLNEIFYDEIGENDTPYVIPAWSLHRLIEMAQLPQYWQCVSGDWYNEVIAHIQSMIYINEFNKEYLEEK